MDSKEIILLMILAVIVIIGAIGFLVMYFVIRKCRDALDQDYQERVVLLSTVHNSLTALTNSISSYMRIAYTSNLRTMIQDLVAFEIERSTKREIMIGKPISPMNFDQMVKTISNNVFESLNQDAISDELSMFSRDYVYRLIIEEVTVRLYMLVRESQNLPNKDSEE